MPELRLLTPHFYIVALIVITTISIFLTSSNSSDIGQQVIHQLSNITNELCETNQKLNSITSDLIKQSSNIESLNNNLNQKISLNHLENKLELHNKNQEIKKDLLQRHSLNGLSSNVLLLLISICAGLFYLGIQNLSIIEILDGSMRPVLVSMREEIATNSGHHLGAMAKEIELPNNGFESIVEMLSRIN